MKRYGVCSGCCWLQRLTAVRPQHRGRAAVAAGLPRKTEPGTKPLCCWSPFPLFQAFEASPFLAFSLHASWLPEEVSFPGACLESPERDLAWPSRVGPRPWPQPQPVSETTQLGVQVTGVGGG